MARLLLACLATATFAASAPSAREITGEVVILERIALPPGSVLSLELLTPSGENPVAEVAVTAQSPLPFALTAPDEALVLLAAVITPDGRFWLSDPLRIAAGSDDVALPEQRATAFDPAGFASTLACGTTLIRLGFDGDQAVLNRGGVTRRLAPVPAASGSRFSDGATPETAIHARGDRALLTWKGQELPECHPFPWPAETGVTARGNEPGWVATFGPEGASVSLEDGQRMESVASTVRLGEDAVTYTAPGLPDITLTAGPCADTMTGLPHPVAVTLTEGDVILTGCGGDPATLLAGDWTVTEMNGAPLPAGAEVSMSFAEGTVSGLAACNRFNGSYALTGEGLSLGPAAGTRMACPEPLMTVEAAFFAALPQIGRFEIDGEGALLLIGGDRTLLRARR